YGGGDYKGTPEMISTLCNNAPKAVEWLADLGMKFRPSCTTVAGGLYQRSHASGGGLMGAGYIATLQDFCTKNGVELLMDTKAEEILMENGRAVGVRSTSGADTVITHATKGVILATGGFGANVAMREKYNTLWPRMDESIPTTNAPSITGDGIVMAEAIGAKLINMEDIQCLPFGDPKDGGLGGLIIRQPESAIFVNKEGKRFVSEYERRDVMTRALLEQTDTYMYIILDKSSYENADTKTSFSTTIGEEVAAGRTFMADTIEDLAKQIGLDPAVLKATVDEYNAGVDADKDAFGKNPMKRIDTAPFYANPRVPTVHHTMGGVQITTSAEVVDANGKLIPGLFAAGEVTGGVHGTNRLGGNAIADIIVFGRIAGTSAAAAK
ncbi:MAG: flavocytochrome c, partial [Pseudoflavonifractor sp.]